MSERGQVGNTTVPVVLVVLVVMNVVLLDSFGIVPVGRPYPLGYALIMTVLMIGEFATVAFLVRAGGRLRRWRAGGVGGDDADG